MLCLRNKRVEQCRTAPSGSVMQHYQHASIIFQRGQVEAILPWCVLPFAIRVEAQRVPDDRSQQGDDEGVSEWLMAYQRHRPLS